MGRHPGLGEPGPLNLDVTAAGSPCALCCGDHSVLPPEVVGLGQVGAMRGRWGGTGGGSRPILIRHELGLTKQGVQDVAQPLWDSEVSRSYFLGQSAFPLGLGSETDPP